jgi:hypothetical protein
MRLLEGLAQEWHELAEAQRRRGEYSQDAETLLGSLDAIVIIGKKLAALDGTVRALREYWDGHDLPQVPLHGGVLSDANVITLTRQAALDHLGAVLHPSVRQFNDSDGDAAIEITCVCPGSMVKDHLRIAKFKSAIMRAFAQARDERYPLVTLS